MNGAAGLAPLRVLTPREASIFACLCDTVVAPEPMLPPVRETDAVIAFDRMLAAAPPVNRVALRALLYVAELAPRPLAGARLRGLDGTRRGAVLSRFEEARSPLAKQLLTLIKSIACLHYYGDEQVSRRLGHDADALVERARALRLAEARP